LENQPNEKKIRIEENKKYYKIKTKKILKKMNIDLDSSNNNKYFVIVTNKKNNILAFVFPDIIKPLILFNKKN
jgi:hypothetical protein